MNKSDLIAIGQYLYGQQWQSALARDLRINDRTVRGWLQGKWEMRPRIAQEIYQLVAAKKTTKGEWSQETEQEISNYLKEKK